MIVIAGIHAGNADAVGWFVQAHQLHRSCRKPGIGIGTGHRLLFDPAGRPLSSGRFQRQRLPLPDVHTRLQRGHLHRNRLPHYLIAVIYSMSKQLILFYFLHKSIHRFINVNDEPSLPCTHQVERLECR